MSLKYIFLEVTMLEVKFSSLGTLTPSDTSIPFELKCHKFPLHLAFFMTINKSQGQSIKHVGLDLRSPFIALKQSGRTP
ncbi:hypothetical protein PAXRUDRAFT_18943 [Paxillus rubicundulus Ve08.2h10]|uniref:DNA helicase n=1 Tax=Paxillus rubicundulus Ve08.2h10 TaxID=930991 RepID=A0A0D0CK07_9AGAM|nr:hypothetical protein PAXRUDRAFT_18943 [Paxillus rubicundulus Ve08.2h10]